MVEYEIRKEGSKEKVKISRVATRKASEIYGDKAKTPDQPLIELSAHIDGVERRIGTIPKPPSNMVSPKSKMASFLAKYKNQPDIGVTVEVVFKKGYPNLLL